MTPHHRFRLADPEHDVEVSDSIEVHTVELTKYSLQEETVSSAPAIEQYWNRKSLPWLPTSWLSVGCERHGASRRWHGL
jgi:hypothetical protein